MGTGLGRTPVFRVDRGDDDITGAFADRLVTIQVVSHAANGKGDTCEIVVDDRDFAILSPSTSQAGATTLKVSLGYAETALYEQGTFQIDEVFYEGLPLSMKLHGNSLGFNTAAKAPAISAFDGMTLGDIVGAIASSAGVSPAVDAGLAAKVIPYLNLHSSHMHLLQELERRVGGMAKFGDGYLSFTPRATGLTASGASFGSLTLGPADFGVWSIAEKNRTAYSKVRVGYWDDAQNQLAWVASQTPPATDSTVPYLVKRAFKSKGEAQDHADATMATLNRGTRQGTLTLAKGDPSIRGGQSFAIGGLRDGVDGAYTVEAATHTYRGDKGIETKLAFSQADST